MNDRDHEQQFLSTPESDRLMAFSMALATELWVPRARLHLLEGKLQASGHLPDGALDDIAEWALVGEADGALDGMPDGVDPIGWDGDILSSPLNISFMLSSLKPGSILMLIALSSDMA